MSLVRGVVGTKENEKNPMIDRSHQDVDDLLEVTETQQKEHRVLSHLLGNLRSQANHHLALRVHMGDVSSYLMSVTLRWVAERVGFAADLPIFYESGEGPERIRVDRSALEQIRQRQPDWRRQLDMVAYLTMRRHPKFPPLLLVGYQSWVYDNRHERWGTDSRAMNDSLTLRGLEPTGTCWDLDDTETRFYAFDGQHRLMAILGLRELVQTGYLHALDQNRAPKRRGGLSREEIVDHIRQGKGENRAEVLERFQHLMDQRVGVEVVPAVRMEENLPESLRRLGQILVDANEPAKGRSFSELPQQKTARATDILACQA